MVLLETNNDVAGIPGVTYMFMLPTTNLLGGILYHNYGMKHWQQWATMI